LATYVPREGLGKANGTISFGYLVGPAIGTFIGGMLMARYGWRAVFIGFGAASFLWLIPWLRFSSRVLAEEKQPSMRYFNPSNGSSIEVRNGFSWPAALFGVFWLGSKQLWMPMAVALIMISISSWYLAFPLWILIGFIGNSLHRQHVVANGYLTKPQMQQRSTGELNLEFDQNIPDLAADPSGPGYRQILRQRGLWGASLGHFAGNFTWYFILSFMPLYLVDVRHLSTESMAGVLGAAYFINAVCAVIAGWYADRWIRRGGSPTLIYKLLMNVCAVVSVAAMLGMVLLPAAYSIPCLVVYEIFLGFSSPGTFGIGQIMAGPTATGRWIGVQNFCGNLAGIIAPALTGWLVHTTGNYNIAFTIAGLVSLIGLFGYLVVLPKVEPIDWSKA
jgi:MFS family permease